MLEPITRPYLYLISAKYWCVRIINRPKYLIIAKTLVCRAWQVQPDDFFAKNQMYPKNKVLHPNFECLIKFSKYLYPSPEK